MTDLAQQRSENFSSLSSGTLEANAKFVRNFSERLANAHELGMNGLTHVLDHCSEQLVFSSMNSADADILFPVIQAALIVPSSTVRSFTLRTIVVVCQHTPISIMCKHWLSTSQKVISILKSCQNGADMNHHSQALVALASLVSKAETIAQLGGEHKASASTMSQSAVAHSSKNLEDEQSSANVITASLSVLFSVLQTAPREVRVNANRLEHILWTKFFNHSCSDVRDLAAKLHVHILMCFPEKLKAKLFHERLKKMCKEMDDIIHILEMFVSSNEHAILKPDQSAKNMGFQQLQYRYSAICCSLIEALQQALFLKVPVSVPTLVHTLCNGIRDRDIDPFISSQELNIDSDDALRLQSFIFDKSMNVLDTVLTCVHRAAILPYTNIVARTFAKRFSKMIIRSRVRHGLIAGLFERVKAYCLTRTLSDTLGSTFIESVAPLFVELFEGDVQLYISSEESRQHVTLDKAGHIPEAPRSRKRRRHNRGAPRNKDVDDLLSNRNISQLLELEIGQQTCAKISAAFVAGLEVTTSFFQNRGVLSKATCICLAKLEDLLSYCSEKNVHSPALFQCLCAAVLGGGSNRMKAEASPLLLTCSILSKGLFGLSRISDGIQSEMLKTRLSCEALFHPRAPPVIKLNKQNVAVHSQEQQSEELGRGIRKPEQNKPVLDNWKKEEPVKSKVINKDKVEAGSVSDQVHTKSIPVDLKQHVKDRNDSSENQKDVVQNKKSKGGKKPLPSPIGKPQEPPKKVDGRTISVTDDKAIASNGSSGCSSFEYGAQNKKLEDQEKAANIRSNLIPDVTKEPLKPEASTDIEMVGNRADGDPCDTDKIENSTKNEEPESDLIMSLRFEQSDED